jgi:hypothetical protein
MITTRIARVGTLAIAVLCLGALAHSTQGGDKEKNLNTVALEIAALQGLDQLDLKHGQFDALLQIARTTGDKPRKRAAPKVSAQYRQALLDLHAALIKRDEKLADVEAKLDELADKEEATLDPDYELTGAARQRAPDVLQLLSAAQVATYIGYVDVRDPVEVLAEALDSGRELKGTDWKEVRDEATAEVGKLLGGVSPSQADVAATKAGQVLDAVRGHAGPNQHALLETEMRKLMTKIGPLQVIRNAVEYSLAELLSNPRLVAAIEARRSGAKD